MNKVIQDFVRAWTKTFKVKNTLTFGDPVYGIFGEASSRVDISLNELEKGHHNGVSYDLVLGSFPYGLLHDQWEFDGQIIKGPLNWLYLLRSANFIGPTGYGIFLLEPNLLANTKWERFEQELNRKGFYIHGVLRTPERLLAPQTNITPILIVIAQTPCIELFVAELLEEGQASFVVTSFARKEIHHSTLSEGLFMPREEFTTFYRHKIQGQIKRLATQYKDYERYSLLELAQEIKIVRSGDNLSEIENAVYIPKIGNSPVICSLEDAKLKHHNYFQIVLKKEVKCEYVTAFFRSDLGKLVLNSLTTESFIPHLNKSNIESAVIALPSLDEQERIVSTIAKLKQLQIALGQFESELALNPTSSKAVVGKLDAMMDSIGALTLVDKFRSLIRKGESKTLEFKETLSLDIKKLTKERYIETSSLKTIVAFLNTDGGILLVGVSDSGDIPGVSREIDKFHNKSSDKFLLHVKNLMKSRIGEQYYPYIDSELIDMDGSLVLQIECKPGEIPCYLDGKDFFVRTNPASDKLEGPKLVEYVNVHFHK
ncbi:ATP-binding protein [Candidatus Latescibacterota bacterium]